MQAAAVVREMPDAASIEAEKFHQLLQCVLDLPVHLTHRYVYECGGKIGKKSLNLQPFSLGAFSCLLFGNILDDHAASADRAGAVFEGVNAEEPVSSLGFAVGYNEFKIHGGPAFGKGTGQYGVQSKSNRSIEVPKCQVRVLSGGQAGHGSHSFIKVEKMQIATDDGDTVLGQMDQLFKIPGRGNWGNGFCWCSFARRAHCDTPQINKKLFYTVTCRN